MWHFRSLVTIHIYPDKHIRAHTHTYLYRTNTERVYNIDVSTRDDRCRWTTQFDTCLFCLRQEFNAHQLTLFTVNFFVFLDSFFQKDAMPVSQTNNASTPKVDVRLVFNNDISYSYRRPSFFPTERSICKNRIFSRQNERKWGRRMCVSRKKKLPSRIVLW